MIDFQKHVETLRQNKIIVKQKGIDFRFSFGTVDQCRKLIKAGFEFFEPGIKFQWIPEYDQIAKYLSDTGNKGLSLIGNSGRGKSLFLTKVFPTLMASKSKESVFYNNIIHVGGHLEKEPTRMKTPFVIKVHNAKEDWGKFTLRIIDEVGREKQPIKGEIEPFPAYVDWCEVNNHPLFFCSNMPGVLFEERYGIWTVDRINKLSVRIIFEGKSLRS